MKLHEVPNELIEPQLTNGQKRAIIGMFEHYKNIGHPIIVRVIRDSSRIQFKQEGFDYPWRNISITSWSRQCGTMGYTVKDFSYKKYVSAIV